MVTIQIAWYYGLDDRAKAENTTTQNSVIRLVRGRAHPCPKSASSSSCFCNSVELPDDGVNVCAAEAGVPQVLEQAGFVAGSVTSHRQLKRYQEVVGGLEVLAHRVDLVDEVLQADDAVFACGPRRRGEQVSSRGPLNSRRGGPDLPMCSSIMVLSVRGNFFLPILACPRFRMSSRTDFKLGKLNIVGWRGGNDSMFDTQHGQFQC